MSAARAVLCDFLLGADPALAEQADFPRLEHREMHRLMLDNAERGVASDAVTMRSALSASAIAELSACLDEATTAANVKHHVAALKRERQMHELKQGALVLLGKLDRNEAPESVQAAIERLRERARPQALRMPRHISETLAKFMLYGADVPVPWGLAAMSELRVVSGELCVPAARPRHGKTALLGTIALAAARAGWQVLFFSLEMPARQIHARLVAAVSGLDLRSVMDKRDHDIPRIKGALEELWPMNLWIEDEGDDAFFRLDLEAICALTRVFCELNADRPTVVLVDYLQHVRANARYEKRHELIAHVCRTLKSLAKSCSVPVIAAAQLGRGVEQRGKGARPQLSDLRESGDIEANADEVVLLHPESPERTKFNVTKYRQGREFVAEVGFDGPRCRFVDWVPESDAGWS